LTFCAYERRRLFADPTFAYAAIQQMLTSSAKNRFAVYAYCFMPDHVHLLVEGRAATAGLERYAKDVKQRIGYHDPLKGSRLVWQPGLYDRVLRGDESTVIVAKYILENPVRKRLVKEPREYPYSGSSEWTWEQMLEMWQTSADAVAMG
jgi:putative transposase